MFVYLCLFVYKGKWKSDEFKNNIIFLFFVIFFFSNLYFILYFKSDKCYDIIQFKSIGLFCVFIMYLFIKFRLEYSYDY